MLIRKANKKDFEDYFKLEQEFMKFNNSFAKYKDLKYKLIKPQVKKYFLKKVNRRNKLFLVLEDKNKLQGFLYGTIEKISGNGFKYLCGDSGYLLKVYITKKYRRKGYFSKMLKEFLKYLKSKKIKYWNLHVMLNNKKVIKIYKKFGFELEQYKMVGKIK